MFPAAKPATEEDWRTEYLDAIIAVRVVDGLEAAIRHIEHYGSHHTDSILTDDEQAAEIFLNALDSAIVLWNASTQFADGGEFGMGGGDRHRHRQAACARAGRRGATHHLQICGARRRPDAAMRRALDGSPVNWIAPPGPVADGLRIGLLGGSFNPAHAGHLYVSETALKRLKLDSVWWLVSPGNPLKDKAAMASLTARLDGARGIGGAQSPHPCQRFGRSAGHRLHDRYGHGLAPPLSPGRFRLADGQRQSGTIQPLAAMARSRQACSHRRGAAARQHSGRSERAPGAALWHDRAMRAIIAAFPP